ncbi:MAG: radical SAM protein [Actinobacteria bacterium]|nr:radical SAM protein [Actinomycetota bacterium]MBU2687152.1 radical SAM protein [Actinomycetota bacterium]
MRVLVVSSNRQRAQDTPLLAFPSGPAYIAGAAIEAGHEVEVFDACFSDDAPGELAGRVAAFDPDVVAVSIRNLSTYIRNAYQDLRPLFKEVTDCLKRTTSSPIVLGGPGFWNYGEELLDYLDLDFGIRGEGERVFPLYLETLERGGDVTGTPGCVFRRDGKTHAVPVEPISDLDSTAFPAFELFDVEAYRQLGTFPAIFTKRGCAFHCTHCPRSALEGSAYRLKSPGRVLAEIERARRASAGDMFYFVDNLFNYPTSHAEAVCRELVESRAGIMWTADSITPLGMTEKFCRLMKESGCAFLCLAAEHGSESMLKRMERGYTPPQIKEAAASLDGAGITYLVTLLLGGPGETPETISEAIGLVDSLPGAPSVLATVGIGLEYNQAVAVEALKEGLLADEREIFEGRFYFSPALGEEYLLELADTLKARPNWQVRGI